MRKSLNKINLLEGNILKKLILLSAPLMATSFVSMAYTLTDTAWVGRLGTEAVAAAGGANFFTWMGGAVAAIARVGTIVYTAQEYGSNNKEKLFRTIKNGIILQIILMLSFTILVNLVKHQVIGLFNFDEDVSSMAVTYLEIFSIGFIVSSLSLIFSGVYNALGNSVFPFIANVIGMILNIVIDPILIFGFGPIPAMGIAGAAYASIFSQLIVFLIMLSNIVKSKNEIYQAIKNSRVIVKDMVTIFTKGLPVGLMSLVHASISLVLGRYMSSYGAEPMAAFSVGSTIESLTWMTTEGLQGGITSFVGQNFGAKLYERLQKVISMALKVVVGIGIISTIIIITFRYQLFNLFVPNQPKTLEFGAMYLLIIGFSQMPMAAELGISGILNGLGETRIPATISVIFNAVRIPISLILMPIIGVYGVWTAMTISSILKGLFSYIALVKERKKLKI